MAGDSKTLSHISVRSTFSHAYALILAGGSGTRFWPLSRRSRPKQLLRLFGKKSLLEQAAARIHGFIPPERTFVFTNKLIREQVRRELSGFPSDQIVAEPASRNTAPAIALAACEIARRDPDAVMIVLPSDHLITQRNVFRQTLGWGCKLAAQPGRSVVIGIRPTRPETGYGYIRLGTQESQTRGIGVFRVLEFTEKPPLNTARRYLRSGRYLWNGGMFIWRASTLLGNLQRYQPAMSAAVRRLAEAGGIRSPRALARLYPRLKSISVDYALMEKIKDVYAVTADLGWSDVGSWATAYELRPKDGQGNVRAPSGYLLDCHENMIVSEKKFTAAIGVSNLVVVETDDALLVCSKDRSQEVGKIVRELEHRKLVALV